MYKQYNFTKNSFIELVNGLVLFVLRVNIDVLEHWHTTVLSITCYL